MTEKDELRQHFSANPREYYEVELFRRQGFARKQCQKCGKFFWTLEADRTICPDQPCQFYEFLGDPPTNVRFDYVEAWRQVEAFFTKHGHTSVRRYPVVCRWRPDLYFTVASIVDFQRVEGGKVIFELPYNPLIVPQMCLRFNDIANVGLSGKHYTSFCMIGQHSVADGEGYWKDRTVELDFELLTGPYQIRPEEITFVEDVWLGYGAFGYSLEYFVRGLELGNAVFTTFEGTPRDYRELKDKVVDMGAGLERFAWITQGTPTSYDSAFGPVVERLVQKTGVEYDRDLFLRYSELAGTLNLDEVQDISETKDAIARHLKMPLEELNRLTFPLEAIYAIADHTRSLIFAVADGMLPSNVGGGYNLRVILRRTVGFIEKFHWNLTLQELVDWHIDYLRPLYPELDEHRGEIHKILENESTRYRSTRERMDNIIERIAASGKSIDEEDLIRLYDSDGITPEMLRERNLDVKPPHDFYVKITGRHTGQSFEEGRRLDVEDLSPTRLLFYEDRAMFEFEAKVLRVLSGGYIVLDKTAFYARAGGQENDTGFIGSFKVVDVEKFGQVVVHKLEKPRLKEGDLVKCRVDRARREVLMRHHTATHIINAAARSILGSWVWQHSASKDVDQARLDITHYAHLSREEVRRIEDLANEVVRTDIPVSVEVLPRVVAEKAYGFRLYQGGAIPSREFRVVKIGDFDVEACGGTHCSSTGEVGLIKILKTERIQDGVERIEFAAGQPALEHMRKGEDALSEIAMMLDTPLAKVVEATARLKEEGEEMRQKEKVFVKRLVPVYLKEVLDHAENVDGLKVYVGLEEELNEELCISLGEQAIKEPSMVYCVLVISKNGVRVLVFSGAEAQERGVMADEVARKAAKVFGGSGGGDKRFGQGGGRIRGSLQDALQDVRRVVVEVARGRT